VPLGSHANRGFCEHALIIEGAVDAILLDLLADAQTSGGMLMGLDPDRVDPALAGLRARGLTPAVIGRAGVGPAGSLSLRF
ncbi:MAG: selenide, water dikinase SelD, partial [Desulfarculus sp.]|nr:selenide, water dikinase SelD [Desulfarculus sp.]